MQVDRRTRGFQLGQEERTIIVDPFTGNHYRVLVVDPDMQRRESLADDLEKRFEIFVAPSNERAFALLGLFQVNFVLLHMDIGNDQTAATSPALAFLREMKRSCFRTPVAALVEQSIGTDHEAQKLLARALQQGGICGYFEEGLAPDIMAERLAKLLRSLTVAQNELTRCRGSQSEPPQSIHTKNKAVSPEFLACIQLDPSMHEALFNLSVARLKLGKDELALQVLTQAIALDPQNAKYLHNRGLMYRRMGLFVQAQTDPPLCRRKVGRSTNFNEDEDDYDSEDDSDETESDDEDEVGDEGSRKQRRDRNQGDGPGETGPPPFHRLIAKPDWPLGFQARTRARKYRRGRRDGLMLSGTPPLVGPRSTGLATLILPQPARRQREKLTARDKNALVQTCVAPTVFGESSFLDRTRAPSKCCVVAESLVEVLLFDHMRLQEMDLPSEVINELIDVTPKYLSEKEVAQKQADVATWDEYKNRRMLELSKNRWPEAKRHLRTLSNGCSIMLAGSPNTSVEPSK
ncbi:hypothetical protein JM16_001041 [Phytophthora kernoviae]|uniref:Uncharacterized protein n=1 Tax=Phytophthora kernoviae TaxID=325452 RepID=A0A8T0MA97_9STRA|nr:hypothetical protein JM16_001041 [Phytophthora kernoviae]